MAGEAARGATNADLVVVAPPGWSGQLHISLTTASRRRPPSGTFGLDLSTWPAMIFPT